MACTPSSSMYNPTVSGTFPTAFFSTSSYPSKYSFTPSIHLSRSFQVCPTNPISRFSRCHASSPSPSPPPEPEPQPPSSSSSSSGFSATISRMQDTAQIFLAVLFWMSLFFWASVWDGRNGDKPSKGSRFRR